MVSSSAVTPRARVARGVTVVLFAAIPVAIIPGGENRFVFARMMVAAIAAGLGLAVSGTGRLPRWAWIWGGVVAACLVLAGALAETPSSAWWGRGQVYDGAPFVALVVVVAVAGARHLSSGSDPRTRRVLIDAMAVVSLIVMLVAVLESFGLRPLSSSSSRPGSLLGNASDEGSFAVLYGGMLVVSAARAGSGRRRWLRVAGAAGALITAVLSESRGAWIGVVVAAVVMAVLVGGRVRWVGGAAVLLALIGVLLDPSARGRLFGSGGLATETASGRLLLWRESLSLWLHHPVFGVGPSQFENAIVGVHDFAWQHSVGPQNPPATPHNLVLQLLLAGGPILVGLAVYGAWRVLRAARRQGSWGVGVTVALAGYLTALMFTFPTPAVVLPAVVLAASVLAGDGRPVPVPRRVAGVCLVAVLAIGYLLASASEVALKDGVGAVNTGRLSQAQSDFSTAHALRWWDADLNAQVFHEFVAAGPPAASYAWQWDARLGVASRDEQVTTDRAALRLNTGRYADALPLLDAAIQRDPHNPQLLLMRGVAYAASGDMEHARGDLLESVRVDPTSKSAWHDLAMVYRQLGQTALAEEAERHAS